MKRLFFLIIMLATATGANAQLTIEVCYGLARENFPLIKRYDLIAQSEKYNLSAATKSWIPQASLSAKASYQSDVFSFPISMPGIDIPSVNKDQYQATIDVTQTLWDGGTTRAKKSQILAGSDVERSQLEVDLYSLRERINNLFFGILLAQEQLILNDSYIKNLNINLEKTKAQQVNGITTQADVDAVQVEIVKSQQNEVVLRSNLSAYKSMLATMIDRNIDTATLAPPTIDRIGEQYEIHRPELEMFNAQIALTNIKNQAINASAMPIISAYAQAGYGSPGLNMLRPNFSDWAQGGLRLQWNFGAFYTKKDQKMNLSVDKQNVLTQQDVFLYNTNLQVSQQQKEVEQYFETIKQDSEIVTLKENIEKSSASKAENGTISTVDFMRDVIDTQIARQNQVVRKIQLMMSVYNLKNTTNN